MTWAITAVKIAAPYIAAGSQVIGAFQTLQAGAAQSAMYNLQAKQMRLKAARDALQYEQQANMVFERVMQTNAAAAAKGFAGGVQGFSGSAKLIQERNEKLAGRDIQIMQQGVKDALSFGDVEASMLKQAGQQAKVGSYFDAVGKLGTAAYIYSAVAPGGTPTTSSAVGTGIPINYSNPYMGSSIKLPRY